MRTRGEGNTHLRRFKACIECHETRDKRQVCFVFETSKVTILLPSTHPIHDVHTPPSIPYTRHHAVSPLRFVNYIAHGQVSKHLCNLQKSTLLTESRHCKDNTWWFDPPTSSCCCWKTLTAQPNSISRQRVTHFLQHEAHRCATCASLHPNPTDILLLPHVPIVRLSIRTEAQHHSLLLRLSLRGEQSMLHHPVDIKMILRPHTHVTREHVVKQKDERNRQNIRSTPTRLSMPNRDAMKRF